MNESVVTINVGKKGVNDNLIREINAILEKKGIVRVRMLRNFRSGSDVADRKELARKIAENVNGNLIDLRGFVLTFKRC